MRPRVATVVFAALLGAACDVPTSIPNWDMTWDFPASSATILVSSILPNGVTLAPNGLTFQANVNTITLTRTLAQDCPQCTAGVATPKPSYTASTTSAATFLPAGLSSATLLGDTVYVTMVNRYQFDPINPGAGAAGSMTFTVASGATVLGTLTLNGPANAIPANGATTTAKIPVSGVVTTAGVSLRVDVTSPQGSIITLTNTGAQQFTYTVRAGGSAQGPLTAANASLTLTNQQIKSNPSDFSFNFGSADRADSALVFVTIANPFNVSGNLNVNFLGCGDGNGNFFDSCPTQTILVSRAVQIAPGTTTTTFKFGPVGAKALLNAKQMGFGGSLSGTTTVTPSEAVTINNRVQLTMHTGSQ
ncbi:MAG TPA: hypothetical protein VGQ44_08405 [Gemmatimonadaceae bacterium]|jgi:hypothetical protein|nr:hypothetical protein [Gemmatimonadaceae bacterium]